ncbi:MAG: triose-phosphate isomerase [Gammaproteobacteria bacterium]|nr:MAG: triose-phosphate isomerase [Gammaproteobacteria bacterium]
MTQRRSLIAGNWKLNGSRESSVELARAVASGVGNGASINGDVLICPVVLHIPDVAAAIDGTALKLGAQNAASAASGAFTGEVAAGMLAEYGVSHVIVGHSERRSVFGETSEQVAGRAAAVQKAGLVPILCVGETLAEREAGRVDAVIKAQLDAFLALVSADQANLADLVLAYEPVWAIGTGHTASPDQAEDVHRMIRDTIAARSKAAAESLPILYGGSVKPDNAKELFAREHIDGGLIGGASLDAESFLAICRAA